MPDPVSGFLYFFSSEPDFPDQNPDLLDTDPNLDFQKNFFHKYFFIFWI